MTDSQERTDLRNSLVALAQGAIKAPMLLNGASAVALLAFIGQVWSKDDMENTINTMSCAIAIFVVGVFLAAFSTFLAYFVQVFYYRFSSGGNGSDEKIAERLRFAVIVFLILSYLVFGGGIYVALQEFSGHIDFT